MRHKINNKYKYNNININDNTNIKTNNSLKIKIKNIVKTILLLIILLIGSSIPLIFLYSFGINYQDFTTTSKLIYMTICDITILIIFILLYKNTIINDAKKFFSKNIGKYLKISLSYWFTGLFIMIISNIIINMINLGELPDNEETVRNLINISPLYMLFDVAIYAPITEEIIFRKSIKDIINNKYLYILVSGLTFGAAHIISSIDQISKILYIIPYASLGIAFASLYKKTDNIFTTISMHALHNTISFAIIILGNIL